MTEIKPLMVNIKGSSGMDRYVSQVQSYISASPLPATMFSLVLSLPTIRIILSSLFANSDSEPLICTPGAFPKLWRPLVLATTGRKAKPPLKTEHDKP